MITSPRASFADCSAELESYEQRHDTDPDRPDLYTSLYTRLRQLDYALERIDGLFDDYPEFEAADVRQRCNELITFYAESFYHTAWQVVLELRAGGMPRLRTLNNTAAARVRNLVLVHDEKGQTRRPPHVSAILPKHHDVSLQVGSWPDDEADRMVDPGLQKNAHDLRAALLEVFKG